MTDRAALDFVSQGAFVWTVTDDVANNRIKIAAAVANWRGAYAAGTAYALNDAVSYGGTSYYCIQAGTGHQPDTSPTWWTPGAPSINWRGAYNAGTAYAIGAGVSYLGASYRANAASTGSTPPSAPWDLLAAKGDPGATGAAASFDATAPTASAVGDAAAVGATSIAARRDHLHGREAFGAVVSPTTVSQAAANGTATTLARSDHVHASGIAIYSQALTPAAVAANTTAEQTFTVTGINAGDIIHVNKPTSQAGLGIVGFRATAANTIGITFANVTAASITPTAAETYKIVAVR